MIYDLHPPRLLNDLHMITKFKYLQVNRKSEFTKERQTKVI